MSNFSRIARIALVIATCAGCASTPDSAGTEASAAPLVESRDGRKIPMSRAVAGIGHLSWVYARSVYEDPVNRPVSHIASLASLALKSTGGLFRRVALGTTQMPGLDGPIPALSHDEPMDLGEFEKTLDRITGTRQDTGRIAFLIDGDEYFGRLIETINNAQTSIDMRTYIFDNDDFAVEMAVLLKERASDVRIRILLDGLGNALARRFDPESLPGDHDPPLMMSNYIGRSSGVKVRTHTNPWFTGDHTKTTIIDKKIAFVGGMNIGREYRYDWHDMMMEVTGPVVDQLQFKSDKAWARAGVFGDLAFALRSLGGAKKRADRDGYPVRILQTRNFDSQIHKAQIAAIRGAQSYILIENPYLSDDRTVYELARARRRGVDVRVIVPLRGNHGPLNASNKITINKLLEHGVRVYQYPGMTHIKAAVYDGWISVGSANFDKLSLEINKELNLATSDPETVEALLDRLFIPDLLTSREITEPLDTSTSTRIAEIIVDELL
jgi:cardiolipin synthase